MTGADFTEAAYREIIGLARSRYPFRRFCDYAGIESGVLWRHDVDVSPHRACALARIEHAEGVQATYFIHLHSMFYNALELEVVERLREIASLGHDIGVHFDAHFCGGDVSAQRIQSEAALLESLVAAPVVAVSFHNPDIDGTPDGDEIGGLVNAYSRDIRRRFTYCSDSNGYWRHQPLREVLEGNAPRLQVLTHPEWWTTDPLASRERIIRAIEGRSSSVVRRYEHQLDITGRTDTRPDPGE